jgi:FHA domain
VRGKVTAEFDTAQGARRLSGERALTWVDEVLPLTTSQVSVWCAQGSSAAEEWPHTDLHRGVVSGGGFVLRRADKGHDTAAKQTIAPTAIVAGGQAIEDPTLRIQDAPVAFSAPHGVDETSTAGAMNAVLVSDDGALYPLDRSYVIGRDPLLDEAVRTAVSTPIALQGDPHISRVHAYVSVENGAVQVRDASTPSGTFIAAPGATEWTAVGTSPTDLPPGYSVRVGERIFTYRGEVSS